MKKKSPIKERILQYIESKSITKYEFYKKTGITRGVLDQESGITESNIEKFIAYYKDVSLFWLLKGEGSMLSDNTGSQSLSVPERGRNQGAVLSLPLIQSNIVADFILGSAGLSVQDYECYSIPTFIDADFLLSVRDVSMYPKFNGGDILACKSVPQQTFIQWNKIYLLVTPQGLLIKRVDEGADDEHYTIISDNAFYKPFQIPRSDIQAMALVRGSIHLE